MPNLPELIAVFEDVRYLLTMRDNDYMWSSWEDSADALEEIDGVISKLRMGTVPSVGVIFAPTGPLQEVSISSGWGDEFIALADRFDAAMACSCFSEPVGLEGSTELGMDSRFAEVSIVACPTCGRLWLRYFYENEAFTGSGRWYLGAISTTPTAAEAKSILEGLDWYFYGGSYYDGQVGKTKGQIAL